MLKQAIMLILLTAVVLAAPLSTLQGTFTGVEVGDYTHLNLKDSKGVARSFWVTPDPSFTPFVEHPEKFKGRQVQVTWHTVQRVVPEAGGKMTINEATSIKLLP